jgi:zinc/manganese transport system substrate-binding protein
LEIPSNQIAAESGLTMGDIHPLGNPHYWTDPANMRIVARSIAERLKKLDPASAADYDANLADFVKRVDEATFGAALVAAVGASTGSGQGGDKLWEMETGGKLDDYLKANPTPALGGWLAQMQPLRGLKIVTYHKSWTYFAERFGLDIVDQVEPKPGIPPSPGHIADLITKMRQDKIKIILMEPFYERAAPDKIAAETGAKVVVVPLSVGGAPEAKDYISLINYLVTRVLDAARP